MIRGLSSGLVLESHIPYGGLRAGEGLGRCAHGGCVARTTASQAVGSVPGEACPPGSWVPPGGYLCAHPGPCPCLRRPVLLTPPPLAHCQVLAAPGRGLLQKPLCFVSSGAQCQWAGLKDTWYLPLDVGHRPHRCGVTGVSNLWGPCRAGPNPCPASPVQPPA